ncbi:MAG TPA: substrate-binding domain-containing protein [Solirubrobacteraceae bacterium]|nr:substrate-binding domain-containing protein [Solirubrobacteraceae bacterium]
MRKTSTSLRHLARPGALDGQAGARRRLFAVPLVGVLTAVAVLVAPALASADTSSTLTIVGTSDVSDSGLVPNLIQPAFNKAYPQYTFKYVGSATGTAIQNAENGTGGPSALIVHAASLENQFVANGFSYNNQYGNAIFTNDFVLAGPTGDPAGVAANGANNIAQAFADVASAGANGKATFYTRGGTTTASGTTVEEHQIWALVNSSGLKPSSLTLCTVSTADGGGMSPVNSTAVPSNGSPCPDSGTVNSPDNPSWYFINAGSSQGANVQAANACTHGPAGSCYVLTDRGTYDYLSSGTDPAGTIPALKIVTRGPQSASAPGGVNALVNYFHVYIINPSKPGETVNLTAAQDFVSLLTSQAFQASLKGYLPNADPAGPPFVADASPNLTVSSGLPKSYHAGKPLTVKGTLVNAEPGYPALASQKVNVDEIVGGVPLTVASGKTNSTGGYSIKFTPTSTGQYEVSTGQISMIENATLNPVYGDILSPAATAPVKVKVHGATSNFRVQSQGGKALVLGTVAPGNGHVKGTVTVFARGVGKKGAFKKVATDRLATSQGNFAISVPLAPGAWNVKVKFQDPRQGVVAATSRTVKVTIGPKPASSVRLTSATAGKGRFTVSGTTAPAGESGAKVELLRLNATPGAPARFTVAGTANLGAGKDKVTFHATKVKHGTRWVLQLEYARPGEAPSFSGLRTVAIK